MAVAAGLAAYVHRAANVGQDVLKESNDGPQTVRFRFHSQQRLLEIEIKRQWAR